MIGSPGNSFIFFIVNIRGKSIILEYRINYYSTSLSIFNVFMYIIILLVKKISNQAIFKYWIASMGKFENL